MKRFLLIATLGLGLAGVATRFLEFPGFEPPAVFLLAVVVEVLLAIGLLLIIPGEGPPPPSFDSRPADGEVPFFRLGGVDATPNRMNRELRSFNRLTVGDVATGRLSREGGIRPLRGRVGLFSAFIGRDGHSWNDDDIARAFQAQRRMGRWIEREAMRHRMAVNFEMVDTYLAADDEATEVVVLSRSLDAYRTVIDERDADVNSVMSASRAIRRLGFADFPEAVARLNSFTDHDSIVWFLFFYRHGRSGAVVADRTFAPCSNLAICFGRESSASSPLVGRRPYVDPATLAHELLHLFGATDKYETPLRSFPARSVTSRDIMRLDVDRLDRLRIDPLTAGEIGWSP